jgi:hypothetical protein
MNEENSEGAGGRRKTKVLSVDDEKSFTPIPQDSKQNAGTSCVALPHGRDEKQQNRSSAFETESAPAGLQLHS